MQNHGRDARATKMKRLFSNLLCTASLLLLLAALLLDCRSRRQRDCVSFFNSSHSGAFVSTGPGIISFGTVEDLYKWELPFGANGLSSTTTPWGAKWPKVQPPAQEVSQELEGQQQAERLLEDLLPTNDWQPPTHRRFGFGWDFANPHPGLEFAIPDCYSILFMAPLWFIELLLGFTPAWRICQSVRRHHRASHGRCITCGYDLRASSNRCPECGTPIALAGSASLQPPISQGYPSRRTSIQA